MMFTPTQVDDAHTPGQAVPAMPQPPIENVEVCGARLAARVREALQTASYVPADGVDIEVRDHVVILSGTMSWEHQRVAAERAVEHLEGVHVLKNGIRLRPCIASSEAKAKILAVLDDSARHGSDPVLVDVDGDSVTLTGVVSSYIERQAAERAASSLPQVRTVRNKLRIVRDLS